MTTNSNNCGSTTEDHVMRNFYTTTSFSYFFQRVKKATAFFMLLFVFAGVAKGQTTVTIGVGTSTQRYPLNYYFGFGRTAMIYTASEIGTTSNGAIITSIAFNCTTATNSGPTVVYLKAVGSTSTESSATWAAKISGAMNVYSGTPSTTSGYRTITLSTAFTLAANQNLEVLVECNYTGSGTSPSTGNDIAYSSATNTMQYLEQDATAPTGSGTVTNFRPNIRIVYTPIVYSSTGSNIGSPGVNWVGQINSYSQPNNCTAGDYRVLNYRKYSTTTTNTTDGRGQWNTTINAQTSGNGGDVTPLNMAGGGSAGFLFTTGGSCGSTGAYTNKWAFGGVAQASLNAVNLTTYNGSTDMGVNMGTVGYYTYVMKDVTNTNGPAFYVGYTTNAPVIISHNSGSQQSVTAPATTITATLSTSPSSQEKFYIRYRATTNDFTSSTSLVLGGVAGTTVTFSLGALTPGTTYYYNILSTTQSSYSSLSEVDRSLSILNYTDNSGSNYSFTVPTPTTYTWRGLTGGVWNLASNWTPNTGYPVNGDAVIFDATSGTKTITSVPSVILTSLTTTGNPNITLQAASGGATITLTNAATALNIVSGSTLTVQGGTSTSDNLVIAYSGAGNTATIAGTMNLKSAFTATGAGQYNATNSATTVSGSLSKDNSCTITSTSSNLIVSGTGTVILIDGENTIPIANWQSGSTLSLQEGGFVAGTVALNNAAQSFSNVTVNMSTAISGDIISTGGLMTSIGGTLTITSTGSGSFYLNNSASLSTISITGGYSQAGGTVDLGAGSGTSNISVGGNFQKAGGTLTTSGVSAANGTFTLTGTSNLQCNSSSWINFAIAGTAVVTLNGATSQTNSSTFTVITNGTLNCGAFTISGSSTTFSLQSAAILGIGSTDAGGAITATGGGSVGNIQVGTRTFSTGAHYTYNGAGAQITGSGLPTTVGNLTVNNSTGVTMTASSTIAVSGTLALASGTFTYGSGTSSLTINGPITTTSGSIVGANSTSHLTVASTGTVTGTLALSGSFGNFTWSRTTGGTLSGSFSVAGNFANSASALNLTTNTTTINFNAAAGTQTLASGTASLYNVNHNGAGILQLSTNALTTAGAFTNASSAGNFNTNSLAHTVTGLATVAAGTYALGASPATQTFNGGLIISGGSFTGSTGTVNTTNLTLSSGILTAPSGAFNISGTWNYSSGSFFPGANTVTFTGGSIQTVGGSPTSFYSVNISGSGIKLGSSETIDGTLTFTTGNFDLNGNNNLTLGLSASISGESNTSSFVNTGSPTVGNGYVGTTRTLGANPGNVANMGLTLTTATAMNSTMIKRFSGKAVTSINASNNSIKRIYSITPTTAASNVTLTLTYFSGELNSNTTPTLVAYYSGNSDETLAAGYTGFYGTSSATTGATGSVTPVSTVALAAAQNNLTLAATGGYYTVQDGDWNTPATWSSNSLPPASAAVVINHLVTVNSPVSNAMSNTTVSSAKSLTFNNAAPQTGTLTTTGLTNNGSVIMTNGGTLTIASGGTFANGTNTFTRGTGTVSFAGSGTVSGTVNFNNVNLGGAVNPGTGTTISGTLQLNSGGSVSANSPAYSGGTLTYNEGGGSGAKINQSLEWPASSGPTNVTILNNTWIQLAANRSMSGNLTVTNGALQSTGAHTLTMNGTTQDITISKASGGAIFGTDNGSGNDLTLTISSGATTLGGDLTTNFDDEKKFFNVNVNTGATLALGRGILCKYGTFTVDGTLQIDIHGYVQNDVSLGANAKLPAYNVSGGALTYNNGGTYNSAGEWPSSASPLNVTVQNSSAPVLTGSRTVAGLLTLSSGSLAIGANTLTVNNINSSSGTLTGSSSSNLTLTGTASTVQFTSGSTNNYLKNLNISSGSMTIGSNGLNITAGATPGSIVVGSGATLTTGGNLTLKSDANGTARIGNSAGTISGDANVERYIPSRRAWKLLTAPLRNAGTIWANWQNAGVISGSTGVNIWGPTGNNPIPGANGLNQGPQYSMKQYNAAANTWGNTVTDTKSTSLSSNSGSNGGAADNKAFLLFVTNPYDASGTNISPSGSAVTTLSARGSIQQGDQTFAVNASNYTLVGNPYASPVDFATVMTHNSSILDRFWLYDATAATLGAYKMVYNSSGTYRIIPSPFTTNPGDPTADDYRHLQSGQAVFVQTAAGAGTLTFSESDKSVPGSSPGIYKVTSAPAQELAINMYNGSQLLDGALMLYDNQFSNTILASEDARKVYNDGSNIAVARNNTGYSVEARPEITSKDTSFLWISNVLANQTYSFSFRAAQFNPLISAWLEDAYTGGRTSINLSGAVNNIDFTTTSDAASTNYARFRIVYQAAAAPLPISFVDVKAYEQNAGVKIEWKVNAELNADHYEVEYSTDGVHFASLGSVNATGNNSSTVSYGYLHFAPATGMNYYRIKLLEKSGSIKYSVIVKVAIAMKGAPGIVIYPNPVINNQAALQLHALPAGNYDVRIIGNNGQTISSETINHNGGAASRQLSLPAFITSGIYRVQVIGSDKIRYTTTITIQ